MYIITQSPNTMGHKVGDFSVSGGVVKVQVQSVALDPLEDPDGTLKSEWINTLTVPLDALSATPEQTIAEWLVSEDGYYVGGILVSDEDFLFQAKRADLSLKVRRLRDQHEHGGCTIPGGTVIDSDPDSQRKVAGATLDALICTMQDEEFEETWRLKDNTFVTLDAPSMIGIGRLLKNHVAACQRRKDALDAVIDAAETVEDLEAIDIQTGWPS